MPTDIGWAVCDSSSSSPTQEVTNDKKITDRQTDRPQLNSRCQGVVCNKTLALLRQSLQRMCSLHVRLELNGLHNSHAHAHVHV